MPTAVLLAWTSPTSNETDREFNSWYANVHIPQVIDAVGVPAKVTRQTRSESKSDDAGSVPRYLAIYEFDTDVETAKTALIGAFRNGEFDMSPTIDPTASDMQWYSRVQ